MNPKQIQRFMKYVKQSRSCWEWYGNKIHIGYGVFGLNYRHMLAHRVSYELFREKIPNGLVIDHLCRNRCCVNPDHLEVVTQQENARRGETGKNNQYSKKTHCPQGHPYDEKNTWIDKNNYRYCRNCNKIRQRTPECILYKQQYAITHKRKSRAKISK